MYWKTISLTNNIQNFLLLFEYKVKVSRQNKRYWFALSAIFLAGPCLMGLTVKNVDFKQELGSSVAHLKGAGVTDGLYPTSNSQG